MTDASSTLFMADCPALTAMEIIASKWSIATLFALSDGPKRHKDLLRLSGGISSKVLTQTLRRLEADGLVTRRRFAESPPRVEYSLSALGETLVEPISAVTRWAREYGDELLRVREGDTTAPSDPGVTG